MTVSAYDNSKRVVRGKIDLDVCLGPVTIPVEFHVIDIMAT